jgi:copper chaperone CopZ
MASYLHHVHGRMRLRSKVLRCDTVTRNRALRKLRTLDGVSSVRLNQKAGSVTVCYDTDITAPEQIVEVLDSIECMKKPATKKQDTSRKSAVRKARKDWNPVYEIGKIAFNVLVSRGVTSLITRM